MANSDAYEKARAAYEALYAEKVRVGNAFSNADALGKARAQLLSASQDYYKAIGDTGRDHEAAIKAIETGVEQRIKAQVATTVTPPVPASAPKPDAVPKLAEAPNPTEAYTNALTELRRNFIDSQYDPTKADAAAKKESVEKSFKEARKAAGFKDDDDKAIATLRGQFEEQRKANMAAYDALTQAVEAQVNGDANITADTINGLRAKRIETRQAYRLGVESKKKTEEVADYNIAQSRLRAAIIKQKVNPNSIGGEVVEKLKREYVDASVVTFHEDRSKAEADTDRWVAELKASPVENALLKLRRATFYTVVIQSDSGKTAASQAKQAYMDAVKAANPGIDAKQLEKDTDAKIAEFSRLAKVNTEDWIALNVAVTNQAKGDKSISDDAIKELRQKYIESRVKALEGIESRAEVEKSVDSNIAGFKKDAAAVLKKTETAYDKAREDYHAAVVARVKHENVDTYPQSQQHRLEEQKAEAAFLAVQPKGAEDAASKKNVEDWKQVYEKEGKKQQIKLVFDQKQQFHGAYAASKVQDKEDHRSSYERALEAMKKNYPTQEFSALGELAAPSGQKPAEAPVVKK